MFPNQPLRHQTAEIFPAIIRLFIMVSFLFITQPAFSVYSEKSSKDKPAYVTGEIIVRFASKADGKTLNIEEANTIVGAVCNGKAEYMSRFVSGLTLVKLPENLTVEDALSRFKNLPGVMNAQPNFIYYLCQEPNDPCFPYLWGLNNTGQPYPHEGGGFLTGTPDADIDAPEAWDIATDSNIIVAVIDSGVDYNHPDLAANMWLNPGEDHDPCGVVGPEDFDGVNDDNNFDQEGHPLVDDIYGWDFYSNDNEPKDELYHGTHVAGIIGAVGNNGLGVTGVCWNVKIMALKASTADSIYINTISAINSIYYAISKGAKIINASWGHYFYIETDQALYQAIIASDANSVLFINSVGNNDLNIEERPFYPAMFDCNNIIAVMATDSNDRKASFSNYHPTIVDLAAPGEDIFSTFPTYRTSGMDLSGFDVNYETIGGTSMAAPYVSGACALLWAHHPNMKHYHVKEGILSTVDKLASLEHSPDGSSCCLTSGRLNLHKALQYKPNLFTFEKGWSKKVGDCVLPGNTMYYHVILDSNEFNDTNVRIVDYLPDEVGCEADPNFIYDENERTVTWDIGDVSPEEPKGYSKMLTVLVNSLAEPLGAIRNVCMYEGDHSKGFAEVNTPVCAWNPGVIYVDDSAIAGKDTGMRWDDAYVDLNDALTRASFGCGDEIWVAGGTYIPSAPDPYYWGGYPTFTIIDGVPLYGRFAGNESSISQRDFKNPANETVLDGTGVYNWYIVTAYYLNQQSILDGFTITGGVNAGVRIDNADNFVVSKCLLTQNSRGIDANDSAFAVAGCTIQNNGSYGIYADYSYENVPETRIENNIIRNNTSYGVCLDNIDSSAKILNNLIHNNVGGGVRLKAEEGKTPDITIRNDTIVYNGSTGIDPDMYTGPQVNSCVIWGHPQEYYWYGWDPTFIVTYCCIEEDFPGQYPGAGNVYSEPCFVDIDVNNFHLKPASDCIDAGAPAFNEPDETDIDYEPRIVNEQVDMGSDEVYWPGADYNLDEIVDFFDFAMLAADWQSPDSNKTLDADTDVDADDLVLFCDDWLWLAPWSETYGMFLNQPVQGDMSMAVETESEQQILAGDIPAGEPQEVVIEPMSDEQIQAMLDWSQELWDSDPALRELVGQDAYDRVIESFQEQLSE